MCVQDTYVKISVLSLPNTLLTIGQYSVSDSALIIIQFIYGGNEEAYFSQVKLQNATLRNNLILLLLSLMGVLHRCLEEDSWAQRQVYKTEIFFLR